MVWPLFRPRHKSQPQQSLFLEVRNYQRWRVLHIWRVAKSNKYGKLVALNKYTLLQISAYFSCRRPKKKIQSNPASYTHTPNTADSYSWFVSAINTVKHLCYGDRGTYELIINSSWFSLICVYLEVYDNTFYHPAKNTWQTLPCDDVDIICVSGCLFG